ncbi:hypothetical protein [Achromobacter xylosoxidans]|uniref:hypothetical protein n=1 Tax=Alcaligenes xylosoxydans xylosoxydans TaxID=85698 RepID=UPI00192AE483|nr:hypothetical protein [Achromobacter xylosoxidans]
MVAMRLEGDEIVLELYLQPGEAGGFGFVIDQTPKKDSGRESARYVSINLYASEAEADKEGKDVLVMLAKGQAGWANRARER